MMDDEPSFNKKYPLYGKLKVVYDNYNFISHKICRQYYTDKNYKRMIDYLYDTINYPYGFKIYKNVIPYIESLPPKQFQLLVQLAQENKIDAVVNLIKISTKV